MTKKCTRCGEAKPVDAFNLNKRTRDGRHYHCKECTRAYYLENRERLLAQKREYTARVADARKASNAAYRDANRERINARKRQHYRENRDRILAERQAYYAEHASGIKELRVGNYATNSAVVRERNSKYRRTVDGFITSRWAYINRRTINGSNPNWDCKFHRIYLEKGIRLAMTRSQWAEFCHQHEAEIAMMYQRAAEAGDAMLEPSVDRIDSDGDYEITNVRLVTKRENCRRASR
jgi:hypothetical protein